MRSSRSTFPLLLVFAVVVVQARSGRAQSTWQGNGSNSTWSTANNWSTALGNGFNTGLVFQGSTRLANTNDFTSGTATSITFDATAGAFTIDGNAIALTGNIANNSSNLQSISTNITLLANSTVTGTNVTLFGTLTNSGANRSLANGLGAGRLLTLGAINLSEGNTGRRFLLSGTGNTTINGPIADGGSGAGTFQAGGSSGSSYSGTVTFAGNSTYTGTTTFGSSTLAVVIGSGSAFGTSRVNVSNNNNSNALSALTDVVLSNTVSWNTTAAIAGSNSIELAGAFYFGNTNLSTQLTSSISSAGGKLLTLSGSVYLQASGSSASATATLAGTGNTTISGVMRDSDTGSGTASLSISNTGTTTLSGNNSYSGGTTLSGANATFDLGHNKAFGEGAVTVSNAVRLQASTDLSDIRNAFTLSNNLTFRGSNNIGLTGTLTNSGGNRTIINGLDAGRQLTLGAINLSENNTGRQLTFTGTGITSITGAIADGGSGAGSLLFGSSAAAYSGTVTLSASNSYTGGTTVQYSTTSLTLVLGDKSALGSGGLNYTNGALTIQASVDLGGSNALSNAVTVATNNLTVNGSNSISFGSLTNSGNSRQVTNNLDTRKTLSFSGTTFLQESGTSVGRTLTVSGSGNTTFSGPIVNGGTGGVSALIIDNTGTTTLSGINTYSGTTRLGNFNGTTTVVIATGSAFGSGVVSTGAATTNGGNPVIIATNDVTLANNFHILAGNTSQNTITFGGTNNITLSSIVYSTNQTVEKRINNSIGSSGTLTLSGGVNLSHSGARSNNFGGTGNTIVSGSLYQAAGATGSLTLDGSGTTTFSGINTYTGATTVSGGGVLVLASVSALPGGIGTTGGQSNLVVSNGIIGLGAGDFTRGLGSGTAQVNLTGTSGFAAFGANRFVNIGGASGTMTWAGTNFTNGPLLLSAAGADGTLDFQNPLALGTTAGTTRTVLVADGSAPVDATLSGIVSGSANLEKSGAGTLQLTAANTYTGTTMISAGALRLGSSTALPTSSVVTLGTGSTSATLDFNTYTATLGSITFNGSGSQLSPGGKLNLLAGGTNNATITVTSGSHILHPDTSLQSNTVIDVNSGATFTLHGVVDGTKSLTKLGSGTLTINGANTYSGGSYLSGGYVSALNTGALGSGTVTIDGNTILNLNNSVLSNIVVFGSGSGAIINSGSFVNVTGTYSITSGTGTSITTNYRVQSGGDISFVNNLASTVEVQSGAQGIFTADVLGGGGVTVNAGGRGVFSGGVTGPITTSGSADFSGGVLGNVTVGGGTATFAGPTDAGSAVNVNSGLAVFTGTIGGIAHATTSTATIEIRNRVLSTADVNAEAGGTVKLLGSQAFEAATIDNDGSVIVDRTANLALAAVISGSGSLIKSDALTLTLTGNNTYSGLTTISGGTLSVGNGGASGALAGNVVNNAAMIFNRSDDTTYAGNISGSGGLEKLGAGKLTLTGSHSYVGATMVSAGTLAVNGQLGGSVAVASGGFLGGSGSIGGVLSGAGVVSPGNSPGILTAGQFDPSAGLGAAFEFTSVAPVYTSSTASLNDVLRLTSGTPFIGNLTSGNVINVYFNLDSIANGQSYEGGFFTGLSAADLLTKIQDATFNYWIKDGGGATVFNGVTYSTLTGVTLTTTARTADFGSGNVVGSITQFAIVIVPEPDAAIAAGIGVAMAGWSLWKRRRVAKAASLRNDS